MFNIKSKNPNYLARIVRLPPLRKHNNADKLLCVSIDSNNLITSLQAREGHLYVYCPLESSLNADFLSYTNSFQNSELNRDKSVKGFFGNTRVRAVKLRGERSEGYIFPLSSLTEWLDNIGKKVSIDDSLVNKEFDSIDDILFIEKYINKQQLAKLNREQQSINKKDKKRVRVSKIIDGQFRLSQDVEQLGKYIQDVKPDDIVAITEKLHGCLHYKQRIAMHDGSFKRIYNIQIGDVILGERDGKLVPAKVLDKFNNGSSDKWLRVWRDGGSRGGVVCTENHRFYTSKGYIQAKDLKAGDDLLYAYKCLKPNSKQWEILVGLMLGDASLSVCKYSCFINISHKVDHYEYLEYIKANLTNLIKPTVDYRTSGYGTRMARIGTVANDLITERFLEMQPKGGKRLFPWIVDLVSPISLAFWYMDDGSLSHTEYQRDRATFAICRYPDEDLYVIERIFRKFDINFVIYKDTEGFNRLRLNHKEAYKFFNLIKSYIPSCMQYKLPEEFRTQKEPLAINKELAVETYFTKQIKVKHLTDVSKSVECSSRWDIETETHNYFAEGVLAHNCNASVGKVLCKKPLRWYERVLKFVGVNVADYHYDLVYSSRTVIKNAYADKQHNHFYDSDVWKVAADRLKDSILDGITLYMELVGYTPTGSFIQKGFDYGCNVGQLDCFVFRITYTSFSGRVFEFSWQQVKDYCNKFGIKHVPELYYGKAEHLFDIPITEHWHENFLQFLSSKYLEMNCLMCKNPVPREGFVLTVQSGDYTPYKHKAFAFKQLESKQLDEGTVDIETQESISNEELVV